MEKIVIKLKHPSVKTAEIKEPEEPEESMKTGEPVKSVSDEGNVVITWDEIRMKFRPKTDEYINKYYVNYVKKLLNLCSKDNDNFNVTLMCLAETVQEFKVELLKMESSYAKCYVTAIIKIMKMCTEECTEDNIEMYRNLWIQLKDEMDVKTNSTETKTVKLMPWEQVKLKLQNIAKNGKLSCRVLALLYLEGYVMHVTEIYETLLDDSTTKYNLNTKTGEWNFVRRKNPMRINLPLELIKKLVESGEQKYLFSGRKIGDDGEMYVHEQSSFFKRTFREECCPANCQKSYLAWLIATTEDMDIVRDVATRIGVFNEATRMINEYNKLKESDSELNNSEIEKILLAL